MNSDRIKRMGLKGLINPCVAFTQVQAIEQKKSMLLTQPLQSMLAEVPEKRAKSTDKSSSAPFVTGKPLKVIKASNANFKADDTISV